MDISKIKKEDIPKIIKILGDEIARTRHRRRLDKNVVIVLPECKTIQEIKIANYFLVWHPDNHSKFRMIIKNGIYHGGHNKLNQVNNSKCIEAHFNYIKRNYIDHHTMINLINKLKPYQRKKGR